MSKVNILQGISTIANNTADLYPLDTVDQNVSSIKTLKDGVWKVWTKGTPESFQGFLNLEPGFGYVVNSDTAVELSLADTIVDLNTLTPSVGLNLVGSPFVDKTIANGFIPRFSVTSIKTIDSSWKVWTKGAPEAFQGFTMLDNTKGYVINSDKVYDKYAYNEERDNNFGVVIGNSDYNALNAIDGSGIVEFDYDYENISIDYTPVAIDATQALLTMYVNVGGVVKLISFPEELLNSTFSIRRSIVSLVDYGPVAEQGVFNDDYGDLTVNQDDYLLSNLGTLDGTYNKTDIIYTGVFAVANDSTSPVELTDIIDLSVLELNYDTVVISSTSALNTMLIDFGGIKSIIEFKEEYLNSPFVVLYNSVAYSGNFISSPNTFVTLGVIS